MRTSYKNTCEAKRTNAREAQLVVEFQSVTMIEHVDKEEKGRGRERESAALASES